MRITSQKAKQLINQLNSEKDSLVIRERNNRTFVAATTENPNDLKPDYDFWETENRYVELTFKIAKLKHALNLFNASTVIWRDKTIDEVLVILPGFSNRKVTLDGLKETPEKVRDRVTGQVIDYRYASFNPKDAASEFQTVESSINEMHIALDKANSTLEFEVDIDI